MNSAYIAAPFSEKAAAAAVVALLKEHGFGCTSRWITQDQLDIGQRNEIENQRWADADLEDVASADFLIALNLPGWEYKGSGGRHVEFGYALALKIPIILVGKRSSLFHHKREVTLVDDWTKLIRTIESLVIEGVIKET